VRCSLRRGRLGCLGKGFKLKRRMEELCVSRQSIMLYWIGWCLNCDAWSIRLLRYLKGGLAGVP